MAVYDGHLVEQLVAVDENTPHRRDDLADRLLDVEGRQAEADRKTLTLLGLHEPAHVGELPAMEHPLVEPLLDFHVLRSLPCPPREKGRHIRPRSRR